MSKFISLSQCIYCKNFSIEKTKSKIFLLSSIFRISEAIFSISGFVLISNLCNSSFLDVNKRERTRKDKMNEVISFDKDVCMNDDESFLVEEVKRLLQLVTEVIWSICTLREEVTLTTKTVLKISSLLIHNKIKIKGRVIHNKDVNLRDASKSAKIGIHRGKANLPDTHSTPQLTLSLLPFTVHSSSYIYSTDNGMAELFFSFKK